MRRLIGLFITIFVISLCFVEIFGTYGYANEHIKGDTVVENNTTTDITFSNRKLTKGYIIVIGVFSSIMSLNIIYIFVSCFCGKKAFDKKYKVLLYILFNVILIPCLILLFTSIGNRYLSNNKPSNSNSNSSISNSNKEEDKSNTELTSNK